MRAFLVAAAISASVAIAGVIGLQASAAAPAGAVPHVSVAKPFHLAACNGTVGKDGCPAGWRYRSGAQGSRCYPC